MHRAPEASTGAVVKQRVSNCTEQRRSWDLESCERLLPTVTGWRRKRLGQRLPKALRAVLQQLPAARDSLGSGAAFEGEACCFPGLFVLHHC